MEIIEHLLQVSVYIGGSYRNDPILSANQ